MWTFWKTSENQACCQGLIEDRELKVVKEKNQDKKNGMTLQY